MPLACVYCALFHAELSTLGDVVERMSSASPTAPNHDHIGCMEEAFWRARGLRKSFSGRRM